MPSNAGFRLVDGDQLHHRVNPRSLLVVYYDKQGAVIDGHRRHTHARDRPSASVRLNTHSAFTDRRLSTFSVDLTPVGDETHTVDRWPPPCRSAPRTASPARAWEVSARLAPSRALAATRAPARFASRRSVTTRAVQEIAGADWKKEVLEVRPPPDPLIPDWRQLAIPPTGFMVFGSRPRSDRDHIKPRTPT